MTSMTSLGIGSGLDLENMLSQLKAAEQTRLTPYTNLQSSYKAKLSTWGQLSSSLSSLQKSVKSLSVDAFNTLSVSSNKAFTATATSEANADSHEVLVTQLATAHKMRTQSLDSADKDLGTTDGGTRTITITQGDGKKVKVSLSDDETSLNDVAKAINKQGGDVQATVQRSDKGYQLVLSSKTTGSDGEMTVQVEGDDKLGAIFNSANGGSTIDENGKPSNSDAMISVTAAQDAILTVDGSQFTRSQNSISDIITGVTLNLKAVSEKDSDGKLKSEQLTLNKDNSAIKSSLKEFIKQYNALMTQTSAATKYVPNDTAGMKDTDVATQNSKNGALVGDSLLRGMVSSLHSTVNGVYGDRAADYSALADLGIKIDNTTGQMTLDESKLDEAIADNPEQIAQIFQDNNGREGMATQLNNIITSYIGDKESNIEGHIKTATKGLDAQVDIVQQQIEKMQKLVDAQVERYRVQFQDLDATMSKLTSMSNSVTSLLQL